VKNSRPSSRIIDHRSTRLIGQSLGQIPVTVVFSGGHLIDAGLKISRQSDQALHNLLQHDRGNPQMAGRGHLSAGAKRRRPS
jgi:hypothetical protein